MTSRPVIQAHVEQQIMALSDALEAETEQYRDLGEASANAEAEYKLKFAQSMLKTVGRSDLTSAPMREAWATVNTGDELREFKIADARRAASKEALQSMRSRIDALRTLAANIRHQT